ncbi:amidohydrolase family protein [Cytobacillus dafuensis]|uniref:Amidohydrolase family protein n=1 Tax=Cytobacillus dafuensis TaxID=1742359 RepID=A0A5B8Z4G2_CYTDA|nr:amidohydrolase family protein [Cytobacillus dafuensis]QED47778.1 amidohydrolase family protein [Cytobacillus dafuensis]
MSSIYMIQGKKIVTVSKLGSIENGAMIIEKGKISEIGDRKILRKRYPSIPLIDCSDSVITPSLIDCHTHLLEFAPSSLYPVTPETHLLGGKAILFQTLSAGITAIGEQICGHPLCNFSIEDYRHAVIDLPLDISFATTSISIGFEHLAHFTSITKSSKVNKNDLIDPVLVKKIAQASDYPGENIFINATPANFTKIEVPRAGEIIYTLEELKQIVDIYHQLGKQIGAHVAGENGIKMALEARVDVLHHAHGISDELIKEAAKQHTKIVATPLGGTHLGPNSPEEILKLVENDISVSISTDSYLPPYKGTSWLPFQDDKLKGPDVLMLIAQPAMKLLKKNQYDENDILALITANPANVLGKEDCIGRLDKGMDANFLVSDGIPGLEITEIEKLKQVYFRGVKVIDRTNNK